MDEIEKELRHWLSIEDWYPSAYTRSFLERTPKEEAADLLAHIAQDADCETPTLWWAIIMAFMASGFTTSAGVMGRRSTDIKAGIRAALLLASLNDPRSIAPLARVWQSVSWKQSKYQDDVEAALIRMLRFASESGYPYRYSPDVSHLVSRIWEAHPRGDLTMKQTDLLLAALHYLAAQDEEENHAAVEYVTNQAAKGANRILVRDTARTLLAGKPSRAVSRMIPPVA